MLKRTVFLVCLFFSCSVLAQSVLSLKDEHTDASKVKSKKLPTHIFSVTPYKPIYILPFHYTSSLSPVDSGTTPDNQKLQHIEFNFQISVKAPVFRDLFHQDNAIYMAYTQDSFWQAYNNSPFFRENNYEPELFLENIVNWHMPGWKLKYLNFGAVHQSNGLGGAFERSWNRLYLETIFSRNHWLISLKAWSIFHDQSFKTHNSDIEHYLGHGRWLVAYRYKRQSISLRGYNNLESGFHRGTVELDYSFPMFREINGFIKVFSGYGQSLIEYNHRTDAVGIGLSFSEYKGE